MSDDAVLAGILRRLVDVAPGRGGNAFHIFAPTPIAGVAPFLVVDARTVLSPNEVEALTRIGVR